MISTTLITDWIEEYGFCDKEVTINASDNLLELGYIDSLGYVSLLTYLCSKSEYERKVSDLDLKALATIDDMLSEFNG